jgi:hypothetical protein
MLFVFLLIRFFLLGNRGKTTSIARAKRKQAQNEKHATNTSEVTRKQPSEARSIASKFFQFFDFAVEPVQTCTRT